MKREGRKFNKLYLIFLAGFCVFYFLYFIFKLFNSSVFLKGRERINVVFYGEKTLYYSLGKEINYFLTFPSEIEVLIPGGYGYYRLGGLGKLVSLEKKPDIFKMSFSSLTSSAVDLYFYPSTTKIYYGDRKIPFSLVFPSLKEIFFNKTNGNIIDRIFIALSFINKNPNRYEIISNYSLVEKGERLLFDEERFFKENQGFFYKKTYRNKKDNVQILYTKSYKTAKLLSRIIEGEGVRVVDISQLSIANFQSLDLKSCFFIENKQRPSLITADLQKFFNCQFKKGETDISDIILVLGKLEKEWEVN